MMIVVVGQFRLPLASIDAARPCMHRVVELSRAEEGCRAYNYAEDVAEPGLFRANELWDSREALEQHFYAPHMAQWKTEREALGLTGRHVIAYEIAAAEEL